MMESLTQSLTGPCAAAASDHGLRDAGALRFLPSVAGTDAMLLIRAVAGRLASAPIVWPWQFR
jgi:hypothetical protein